jgi:hypothetical protein
MPTTFRKHGDNAIAAVAVGRSVGGTTLGLAAGAGAAFAADTGRVVAVQAAGWDAVNLRIVDLTRRTILTYATRSGDTFSGVAVQAGYADLALATGDVVFDAGTAEDFADLGGALNALETTVLTLAPLASPAFTGTPTAPTPSLSDVSTALATTAFVIGQGYGSGGSPSLGAAYFPYVCNGTDDTAGLQAVLDAAGAAGGGRIHLRASTSRTCRLKTPLVWDQDFLTWEFDPGMTVSAPTTTMVVGMARNCVANGNITSHGRHRVALESIVTDGSFAAGTLYAINLADRSVEVQGTPNSGAAFTLNIDFGSGLAVNTGSIAANPGASAATVAAAMTAAVASLAGHSDAAATCTGGPIGTAPVA